ncbi:MAG: peptidylprolyl isomerase [Erysipelotrichaceae bacterium]|jgi:peptidyl-prolyl cis-trans isomerase B (cyclophilin B)
MIIIEMNDGGIIKLQLDKDAAPITVANFKKLVNQKFYDGLIFHRVIKGFMIQGGDPTASGTGGSDERIKGEFSNNGVNNPLKHQRGVISMARSQHPDSASSQFFIMHQDSPYLDGSYAAFGKVIEGIEVVDSIANCKTDWHDKPVKEQKIKRIYEL